MGKGIAIWLLVPLLIVGMVLSPFPAMETAEASSVSNAWVELSDGTALNKTGEDLEYIIHFTTTTALSGGKDTITIAFPNGTTEMAGEEGSGYAFSLPRSIAATNVAVDPDGALTTTTGYTAPIVGATVIVTTLLLWGGEVVVADAPALSGDVNGDGMINSLDITAVERIIAGMDAQTAGADANQDGVVNSLDITKTERIVAGLD